MKFKKILAAMTSAAILLSMGTIPEKFSSENIINTEITASAYDRDDPCTDTNGTCGDNLTWELSSDGVLTISGTGEMTDYNYDLGYSESPFYYRSDIKSVVIKDSVTSIGFGAFYHCYSLTSIKIPDRYTY